MPSTHGRSRAGGFTLLELLAVVAVLGMVLFFVMPNLDNLTPTAKLHAHARKLASTIELAQGEAATSGREFVLAYDLNRNAYWVILPPPVGVPGSPGTVGPTGGATTPFPGTSPFPGASPGTGTNGVPGTATDPNQVVDDPEHGPPPDLAAEPATGPGTTTTPPTTGAPKGTGFTGGTSPSNPANYSQRETLPEEQLPDEVKIISVTPLNGREQDYGIVYVPFSSLGDEGSHIVVVGLRNPNGTSSSAPGAQFSIGFNALTRTVDFSEGKLTWQVLTGG